MIMIVVIWKYKRRRRGGGKTTKCNSANADGDDKSVEIEPRRRQDDDKEEADDKKDEITEAATVVAAPITGNPTGHGQDEEQQDPIAAAFQEAAASESSFQPLSQQRSFLDEAEDGIVAQAPPPPPPHTNHPQPTTTQPSSQSFARRLENPFAIFDTSLFANFNSDALYQNSWNLKPTKTENDGTTRSREEIILGMSEGTIRQDEHVDKQQQSRSPKQRQVWKDTRSMYEIEIIHSSSSSSPMASADSSDNSNRDDPSQVWKGNDNMYEIEMMHSQFSHDTEDDDTSLKVDRCGEISSDESMDRGKHSLPMDEKISKQHSYQRRWLHRRSCIPRAVVAFSLLGIVISAILAAVLGVNALLQTMEQMLQTVNKLQQLAEQGVVLMDGVVDIIESSERMDEEYNFTSDDTNSTEFPSSIYNVIVHTQGQVCGGIAIQTLCQEWAARLANDTTIDGPGLCVDVWGRIHTVIEGSMDNLRGILDGALQTLSSELGGIQGDLIGFVNLLDDMEKQINDYEWVFSIARALNLVLAGLCLLILCGLFCKSPRLAQFSRHWITAVLFTLLVFLSSILSLACIFSATVLADFCIDGPDSRVLSIVSRFQETQSVLVYEFARYFVNQCPLDLLPGLYAGLMRIAWVFVSGLYSLSELMTIAQAPIHEFCGTETSTIQALSGLIASIACDLSEILTDIIIFFQCDSIWTLYESGVYNALCVSSTGAVTWIAATQLAVAVFAGLVLTFRMSFSMEGKATQQ